MDQFLSHHKGPGIQHIGLHTDDIIHAVSQLKDGGVQFAEPPYTYYTEVGNETRHKVIKLFLCSTQLSMKFVLLINVKMQQ